MLPVATSPPRFVTLVLLTGLATLSLNMFLPSLSNIAEAFNADYALVNFAVAGYAATTAALQLILGPLSDRYGRRPVMLASLVTFVVASIGCLFAADIWTFLAFRLLQGMIIAGWVIAVAMVRDIKPAQEAASLIGYISMAMAIAPMLGPMVGGALDDLFGWRASFVAMTLCGVVMFVISWIDLGETNAAPSSTFAAQFRSYPDLLRSRRFWGYALCMASTTAAFYVFLGGIPLVAKSLFDMSTTTLGIYMGTTTVGFFAGSFLAGRFSGRVELTTMMIIGRVVACGGLVAGLTAFATTGIGIVSLFGAVLCVGLGNGLSLPGASSGAMSVRPKLAGSASGLSGAMTLAGGAAMSAITGALLGHGSEAYVLLGMMLLASAVGLAAAAYVRWLDGVEAPLNR